MPEITEPNDLAKARAFATNSLRPYDDMTYKWINRLADEIEHLREIAHRARMVEDGRPTRPDRHVALCLSKADGPTPHQASMVAQFIRAGDVR